MNYVSKIFSGLVAIAAMTIFTSCDKERSGATGWSYNEEENGGFERQEYVEQETGPGLVLVEGGTFTMGRVEDDLNFTWDNIPRRVTVSSFYMDETEVTNVAYREYTYWLQRVFGADHPEFVSAAKPDSLCWRRNLAYNEPYVKYYFTHPSYNSYPVVGVTWLQATEYCNGEQIE